MDQQTITPKLNIVQRVSFFIELIPLALCALIILIFHDWHRTGFFLFPFILCSSSISFLLALPKHNIKTLLLDRRGITIRRNLLKDIFLPYDKLTYVWNYTFYFQGFELDTNLFDNKREIIEAINVYKKQGLIAAPERKPNLREFIAIWAMPFIMIIFLFAYMGAIVLDMIHDSGNLANIVLYSALIVAVFAFAIRTAYRYLHRVKKPA